MLLWQANNDVYALMQDIKNKHHQRLEGANIALAFSDSKSFVRNRFNFGKALKFTKFNKLWQNQKFDLAIVLPSDTWHDLLNNDQRLAILDLHLSRCTPKYLPEYEEVNGKKIPVKDEYGRTKLSNQPKVDDEGEIVYEIMPLDLFVFCENIKRFGLWLPDFSYIKEALSNV